MKTGTRRLVTVVENDAGVALQLDARSRSLLDFQNKAWEARLRLQGPPFAYRDGFLTARDVAGFVTLGDVVVEVVPKFLARDGVRPDSWRIALWAILARVYRLPALGETATGDVMEENRLPDLLGHMLLNSLRASRPNGLPMGYVSERGNLRSLRGRLDVGRLADALIHPGTIPCEYDSYSEDVPINRMLRWSAEQLAPRVWSVPLGHALAEEALAFSDVSPLPPSQGEAERITLAPHHALLQPAVAVGQILLTGHGLQHGLGTHDLPGFLWKSPEVFEFFVRHLVQSAVRASLPGIYVTQGRVTIAVPVAAGRELTNDPDLRLVQNGKTVAVLDAKYKTWSNTPAADDVRQVVVGAWSEDCGVAGLIYPNPTSTSREPDGWRLVGPGNPRELWAMFVDLAAMGTPDGEHMLVNRLAGDLRKILPDAATQAVVFPTPLVARR